MRKKELEDDSNGRAPAWHMQALSSNSSSLKKKKKRMR
jgi:hypothetical protein